METLKLTKIDATLPEQWARFSANLNSLDERLMRELEVCWQDLQGILENQLEQLRTTSPDSINQPSLKVFRVARAEAGRALLTEPLLQWERRRPYKRAMLALDAYDRGLKELIRSLPESVEASGAQAIELFGRLVTKGLSRRFVRLRRKERPLPLRAIIGNEVTKLSKQRARAEGEYLLVLAKGIQELGAAWELRRETLDVTAQGKSPQEQEVEALKREAKDFAELLKQAEKALSVWRDLPGITKRRLASRILGKVAWGGKVKSSGSDDKRADCLTHWSEQLRSLEAEIGIEQPLERIEDRILNLTGRSLESLAQERRNLLAELDGFADWLRQRLTGGEQADIPLPKTAVVPAISRVAEFDAEFKSSLQSLPETVRTISKFSALPRRRMTSKELRPAKTAYEAFERSGRHELTTILQAIESEHHGIEREIEQAREVVAFGLSEEEDAQNSDPRIVQDALQNALSLLEFHRGKTSEELNEADSRLVRIMAAVFTENRLMLSRDRLGALTYLGRQNSRQAFSTVSRLMVDGGKRAIILSLSTLQNLGQRFLVSIGWLPEQTTGVSEVIRRPFLPQEFTVDLNSKDLPAIYRRLFRFEAVRDPRFLIGREHEIEAITEARLMWEAGRPIAMMIIGERGSGKTSLINCAIKRPLEGLNIVRGEFNQRMSDGAQLREFVAKLIGVEDSAELEEALNNQRRVLILEEIERSFLRQIGHYSAIRELQRLIAATCRSTLWVVVTNQIAFRFMDASVSLGKIFSHRINAASATRDALRDAILLRHNLSGLRLQFWLPPEERTIVNRIRNRLRGQANPEKIFFDQLAKESAGVFRTAFEIWLGQIDSAQAGALLMKPLATPNLTPIIEVMDPGDLFTLVAVMQHGSLTAEEHSIIFQKSLAASRAQLDELLAREIIEPDPGRPGFRVRPEALRVVKEALYRRNLL